MAKQTPPTLPPGPRRTLSDELHALHRRAGWPSLRDLVDALGNGVASRSRIGDVFAHPRLPAWGLLELLVTELASRARRPDPTAEVDRFHALWEAAAEASDKPGGPVDAAEDLGSVYLRSPIEFMTDFREAAAATVLVPPPPRQAATPLPESQRPYTMRDFLQGRLDDLKERIRKTRLLLVERRGQVDNLIELDEVTSRQELLESLGAVTESVGQQFAVHLRANNYAGMKRTLETVLDIQSRVDELWQHFPGEPS
ncbi:hypothetical protein [Streptomyces sp. NPDC047974]|uniref:hypothetical protein n=1 Tax=Streptomyces sp. NPDC047974 TaxID=3154343 RepID=UPI00340DF641